MARGGESGSSAAASHEPTARRLADARRAGQVAHSADLRGAIALAATGAALAWLGPSIVGQLVATFAAGLRLAPAREPLGSAAARALDGGARILSVPLAVVLVFTLAAGLIQTGGLWLGPPRPELGRLRPGWAGGRGRDLAAAGAGALAGLAKAAVVALVAALALGTLLPRLCGLAGASAARALAAFGVAAQVLGGRLLLALLLLGALDYAWVRGRHRRALRMTRREIERERREQEGDPGLRAERRRRHGEPSLDGALGGVARADLVVTGGAADPSLAVALAYQPGGPRAPVVVAVGRWAAAATVLAAARAASIPVVPDPDLAAVLERLEAGAEIPEASYQAVAELLRAAMPHGASRQGA